ncbi:MAG: hypothetical protein K2X99_04460 [Gemmatimonadaceae bacterium]|nr:hypothetical protein [Gemmatimonadaceae bacterium]
MAYLAGTSDVSARSHTVDVGSIGGALGVGGAITKTTGVSQSALAQRAAPPQRKSIKWPVVLIVVSLFGLGEPKAIVGVVIWVTIGAYWLSRIVKYNSMEWSQLHQVWLRSWMCQRCGEVYQVP